MDNSLRTLCDALKKIFNQLKPQINPVSFILITGKHYQGKSALMQQSHLQYESVDPDGMIKLFYNSQGVILELGETWLNQSESLLTATLKQLNRCNKYVKISGVILCIAGNELLQGEPSQLIEQCKSHNQLLERFGEALGYCVDVAIMLTKLDTLAGFCEFFQSEHASDLKNPLGFSLECFPQRAKRIENYKQQFDQMIEVLGQQIINKLHPARSSIKRTLIREFPLQLASLRIPIQALIQNLSPAMFKLRSIYFTSAEQGGLSIDQLNKKIQHEYALTVQDKFPQSTNYRAYFIDGALNLFQKQTSRYAPQLNSNHKMIAGIATASAVFFLALLGYQHLQTSRLLDEATKELIIYETLLNQNADKTSVFYQLSLAEEKLGLIPINFMSPSIIKQLKIQLHNNTQHKLHDTFLPEFVSLIEEVINNQSQSQLHRYQALKIYIMLSDPQHFSEGEVMHWFSAHRKNNNLSDISDKQRILLKNALKQPIQPIKINQQLVLDARNYLNALPTAYLYYSLAKGSFPQEKIQLKVEGFELASTEMPVYFSKEGFNKVISALPQITEQLQQENWVLGRQDLNNIQSQLEQAYCLEYSTWWQKFTRRSHPEHYQNYKQARQLAQTLYQNKSMSRLINLIQQNTSPDLADSDSLFNQKIAHQFTAVNLMASSANDELTQNLNELEKFLSTLSVVHDDGQTIFNLTKARFRGENMSDPLNSLYNKAKQLPEPVSNWAKQVADDTWFILINESKTYLNKQWHHTVFNHYKNTIANRYPLDSAQKDEVSLNDFDRFFAPQGILNTYVNTYLKPFLDTSQPQWQAKEVNGFRMPVSAELLDDLIRANIISNMFFPDSASKSKIEFSLQKINLDPVVANLQLTIGETTLTDNQNSDSYTYFSWPQPGAKLSLNSIEGNHFELDEEGSWAFFRMLQKVNVLVDNNDSSSLQILFEVNGNSGRYLLKTQNQINPFSPGILTGFSLKKDVV